jgi:hypothetical protein
VLTLFTIPKQFKGHIEVIQRNAIKSWTLLNPRPEIILFGNDEGTAEIARELDLSHIPDVACNEYGTPLINMIFDTAQQISINSVHCYVNADIIFMNDFIETVKKVSEQEKSFLIVGRRWDVDIKIPLNFEKLNWDKELKNYLVNNGTIHSPAGIDYFVFSKGLYKDVPPFAIGRTTWDNWLIFYARSRRISVIDATDSVTAIHQNHDYSHYTGGLKGILEGTEAQRNLELAGGLKCVFTIEDATHKINRKGNIKRLLLKRLKKHLERFIRMLIQLKTFRDF